MTKSKSTKTKPTNTLSSVPAMGTKPPQGMSMPVTKPSDAASSSESHPITEALVLPTARAKHFQKQEGGLQRSLVLAELKGLELTAKSSDHYHLPGLPLGKRLVLPARDPVLRIYGYLLTDESLPGFVNAEGRKAHRLGAVSVVCDNPTIEQVRLLAKAVTK